MDHPSLSPVTQHEVCEIRSFIEQRSGMSFDESRSRFFTSRLLQYMQQKRVARGTELLRILKASNTEYEELLQRVLTQETSFFRYPEKFRAFQDQVLPEIYDRRRWSKKRSLRVWSAGCSTGEEPYSIAISVLDKLEFPEAWEIQILATDISRKALDIAATGKYPRRALSSLTSQQVATYFTRENDEFVVRQKLKDIVDFAPLNLAQMVYMGRFDCIFCMNVLIYFSSELRTMLIRRFARYLEPGGYLFLGHAESAANAGLELDAIVTGDSLIYRKRLSGVPGAGKVL